MSIYEINEASINIPELYNDESVNFFLVPETGEEEFSVVIRREPAQADQLLDTYVFKQLAQLKTRMPKLTLVGQNSVILNGLPAVEVEFTWISKDQVMRQHQVYLIVSGMTVTITAISLDGVYPKYALWFEQLISSIEPLHSTGV